MGMGFTPSWISIFVNWDKSRMKLRDECMMKATQMD